MYNLRKLLELSKTIKRLKTDGKYDSVRQDEVKLITNEENGFTTLYINGSDDDPREWANNFYAIPKKNKMHRGYRLSAIAIYERYTGMVDHNNLVVTGHSRGGGIAQAYAHLFGCKECVTFGSPRVFAPSLQPNFNHTRVFASNDPVDNIPPFWLGFKHYSTSTIKLDGHGRNGIQNHKDYITLLERAIDGLDK